MLYNLELQLGSKGVPSAMDDGGRCLLVDVISDPQLLQSFLDNEANGNDASQRDAAASQIAAANNLTPVSSATQITATPIKKKAASKSKLQNQQFVVSASDSRQVDLVTSSVSINSPMPHSKNENQNSTISASNSKEKSQAIGSRAVTVSMSSGAPTTIPSHVQATKTINLPGQQHLPTSYALTSSPHTVVVSSASGQQFQLRQTLGGQTISWPQAPLQMQGARSGGTMTVMPQQLLQMPGGLQHMMQTVNGQVVLTRPGLQQMPNTGQLVQIIQTPNGAQIVQSSPNPPVSVQSSPAPVTPGKNPNGAGSAAGGRGGTKQILPKPSGSPSAASASKQSQQQATPSSRTPVLTSMVNTQVQAPMAQGSLPPTSSSSPQIVIGPGGQPASLIQGPNGTLMLNPFNLQGQVPQQFVIQGGLPGAGQHLTLRVPQGPMVTVSSAGPTLTNSNTPLLSALTAQSATNQQATLQRAVGQNQPQTFVIPSQGQVGMPGQGMVSLGNQTGTSMFRGPNGQIFLTRPQPQQMMGAQPQLQMQSQPQQFIQINTPNGPMLVALQGPPQAQPQFNAQNAQQPGTISLGSNPLLQSLQSNALHNSNNHQTLQTILAQAPQQMDHTTSHQQLNTPNSNFIFSSGNTLLTSSSGQQFQQSAPIQTNTATAVQNKRKSVNLADLLAESGILPESTPPSSPSVNQQTNSTADHQDATPQNVLQQPQPQQTVFMMPSGPNQSPNIVLGPQQGMNTPQLRLALGPDGSVILQPSIAPLTTANVLANQQAQTLGEGQQISGSKLLENVKDNSGPGSSQPSPDSTTPTLDTAPVVQAAAVQVKAPALSKSALIDQLISGKTDTSTTPNVVKIKEEDNKPALIPVTVQSINTPKKKAGSKVDVKPKIVPEAQSAAPQGIVVGPPGTALSLPIRLANCDSVLESAPLQVLVGNPPSQVQPAKAPLVMGQSSNGPSATGVDQNGVPVVQISLNNVEFRDRLESQIKNLSAIEAPGAKDSQLLQDLLNLQKTISDAKKQGQAQALAAASEPTKVLLSSRPQPQLITSQMSSSSTDQSKAQLVQQNTHQQLVNLLKPGTSQQAQQIRLLTTPMNPQPATTVSGTTTYQLGNNIITITTPGKAQPLVNQTSATPNSGQTSVQSNQPLQLKPQLAATAPTLFQVVRLQSPQTPLTTPSTSSSATPSPSVKSSPSKSEPSLTDQEKSRNKAVRFFQQQLAADQNAALKPDVKTPFKSSKDACRRLLRYHVFNTPLPSQELLLQVDSDLEIVSKNLLIKKSQLLDKYRHSVLKLSMKTHPTSESIMLDKLFVNDETNSLKLDKEVVAQGRPLDLPPPPVSWSLMVSESINEEEERLEFSRKRKSDSLLSDLDILEQLTPKKPLISVEEPVAEPQIHSVPQDESEDEDDDSDDDDEDEDDEHSNDITKYLEPPDGLADISGLYNDMSYDQQMGMGASPCGSSGVMSNFDDQQSSEMLFPNPEWSRTPNDFMHTSNHESRGLSWNDQYVTNESDAAVDSILSQGDSEEQLDLSSIGNLDEALSQPTQDEDEDDDEDDDDEDEEDEAPVEHPTFMEDVGLPVSQQPCDVQMQCAIDSILDMPSTPPAHMNSFYHQPNQSGTGSSYGNRPFSHMMHGGMPMHRNNMNPFGSGQSGQSDPMLDEAVKSILS